MNKISKSIGLVAIALLLFQCKTDEPTPSESEAYVVNYKDQGVKGKIGSSDWTYLMGNVSESSFLSSFSLELIDVVASDSCIFPITKNSKVFFSTKDTGVLKTGTHTLSESFTTVSETVTMVYYDSEGIPNNVIAGKGAYEILSVDTVNNIVQGKIDAYYNDENYINGNFKLYYCK